MDAGFLQTNFWQYAYFLAAVTIVFSIKWLSSPATSRRGVIAGEVGFALAILGTLLRAGVTNYPQIVIAMIIGAAIGAPMALLMPMTAVPQFTALSHAFGALAAALVGTAEYYSAATPPTGGEMVALTIEVLLGYLTFTASIMAFAKLQDLIPTRPMTYTGQNFVNLGLLTVAAAIGIWMIAAPAPGWAYPVFIGLSLLFGVLLILPIGGGDRSEE